MAHRRESINRAKGRDHRPHHISAIAHHFLDEEGTPDASSRQRRRDLAVCSPAAGPAGAWVCAGLARSLAAESVILGEHPLLSWSATSYLSRDDLQPVPAEEIVPGPEASSHNYWQVMEPAGETGATFRRPAARSEGIRILLRNLGFVQGSHLADLEAVHLPENLTGSGLPGKDGLIWCLKGQQAVSLSAAYHLGRILALLKPRQLEVMLVDENWQGPERSRRSGISPESLHRCRQLVTTVCPGLKPSFSTLDPGANSRNAPAEKVFLAAGRRLLAADYSD